MSGAEAAEELPPPVRYAVEPRDLGAVRVRQVAAMRRDMAPVLANVIPLVVGVAYAGCVYLAFKSLVPRPIPGLSLLVVGLCVFGVSLGGLAQWAIARWSVSRALARFDERIAGSAAGGDVTATLDHEGLTIASAAGVATNCVYTAMTTVKSDKAGLFVMVGQDLILHVPQRAFGSEETLGAWVAAIGRRRTAARPSRQT